MMRLSYRGSRLPRFAEIEQPEATWIRFVRDAQRHWRVCGLPVCRRARQCAGATPDPQLSLDVPCAGEGKPVPPMPFDFGYPWLAARLGVSAPREGGVRR